MSMLRTWWGGGDGGDKDPPKDPSKDGEKAEPANQWVKGLGDIVSSVSGYASNLKETVSTTVQNTSFLSEFDEEQKKFERETQRQKDTAVPPWVGFNEEEQIKAQILELSSDSRNVLRNPPPGVQFHFDFAKSYPVALSLLKEDSRLQKLRFELVPKKLKEERFWHNYFYRVFLIKQSSQLASLASAEQHVTCSPPPNTTQHQEQQQQQQEQEQEQEEQSPQSTTPQPFTEQQTQVESPEDFASDALVMGEGGEDQPISRESVRAELDQLGVDNQTDGGGGGGGGGDGTEEWEQELAKELEDLGLEDGGGAGEGVAGGLEGDEQWENELKQMLESHDT